MKNIRLLIIFLLLIIAGCNPVADDVYKVVKVKDGDTLELLGSDLKPFAVRLAGIDCPEKTQDFGQKAKQFTALLCFGKDVKLQGNEHDRYGRTVATVLLTDGQNINYEIVKHGYAWHYKAYSNDPELARLEQYARDNRLGLWQDANPIAPWEYRKNRKAYAKPKKESTRVRAKRDSTQRDSTKKKRLRKKRRRSTETVSLTGHYNLYA